MRRDVDIVVELEVDGVAVEGFPYHYRGSHEVSASEVAALTTLGSYQPIPDGDVYQPLRVGIFQANQAYSVRLGNQSDGTDVTLNANGLFVLCGVKVIGVTTVMSMKVSVAASLRSFMAGEYIV